MKHSLPNRPRRRATATIAALAAVLAVAVAAVLFGFSHASSNAPEATDIPRYAPADADTLVIAPYTDSWWTKVGAMAPQEMTVEQITPAPGLQIQHVGYSRSQDHTPREIGGTGPLRLFYVESPDAADASAVLGWLQGAPGYEHRLIHQFGRVLVVSTTWVRTYPQPQHSMASVAGYTPAVTQQQASMFFSPQLEVASLAGGADTTTAKAMSTYLASGYGFTTGTAWSGTSRDGNAWDGSFTAGGVNGAQIDFSNASAALMSQRKILARAKNPATSQSQSSYEVIDPGLSSILAASSLSVPEQPGALGDPPPGAASAGTVANPQVSAVIDINTWDRAISGNLAESESVLARSMTANGKDMKMTLTYAPTIGK